MQDLLLTSIFSSDWRVFTPLCLLPQHLQSITGWSQGWVSLTGITPVLLFHFHFHLFDFHFRFFGFHFHFFGSFTFAFWVFTFTVWVLAFTFLIITFTVSPAPAEYNRLEPGMSLTYRYLNLFSTHINLWKTLWQKLSSMPIIWPFWIFSCACVLL